MSKRENLVQGGRLDVNHLARFLFLRGRMVPASITWLGVFDGIARARNGAGAGRPHERARSASAAIEAFGGRTEEFGRRAAGWSLFAPRGNDPALGPGRR